MPWPPPVTIATLPSNPLNAIARTCSVLPVGIMGIAHPRPERATSRSRNPESNFMKFYRQTHAPAQGALLVSVAVHRARELGGKRADTTFDTEAHRVDSNLCAPIKRFALSQKAAQLGLRRWPPSHRPRIA